MTWHAGLDLVDAYLEHRLDYAQAASVEAHLAGCTTCRSSLVQQSRRTHSAVARHEASWDALVERVDRPRLNWLERVLVRCGAPEHVARLVSSSELTRGWWLAGVSVLFMAALLAQHGTGVTGVAAFVLLAPVLPVAGITMAYGAMGEAAYEIAVVAPYSSLRRALVRSVTIVALWLPAAMILSLGLPGAVPPVVWLLPALALSALTLALSSFVEPVRAASILLALWLVSAVPVSRGLHRRDVDVLIEGLPQAHAAGQAVFLALSLGALVVVILRRSSFERLSAP